MKAYRLLTGPDDASFCHKVTAALNAGWELYGQPSLTYDSETKRVICGQAVVKTIAGATYDPEMKLGKL